MLLIVTKRDLKKHPDVLVDNLMYIDNIRVYCTELDLALTLDNAIRSSSVHALGTDYTMACVQSLAINLTKYNSDIYFLPRVINFVDYKKFKKLAKSGRKYDILVINNMKYIPAVALTIKKRLFI